jgi:type II secretory pathway component PulM
MKLLQQYTNNAISKLKPYYEKAEYRFKALTYREKVIVIALAVFTALYIVFISINAIIKYRYSLQNQVNNLKVLSVSVDQIANEYKVLKNVQPNSTNKIDINNLKQEIKTELQVNTVDVDVQENQIIISGSMVSFEKVILLLEQLKKSYNVFPEKANFVKAKSGMVSFSFTIWMNN